MNWQKYSLCWITVIVCLIGAIGVVLWDQAAFDAWKADLNPWMFFLMMAIMPAFGVPTSPFYLVAGLSFQPLIGLGGGALAIAANLLLSYLIAKSALRHLINRLLRNRKFQLPKEPPKQPIRYTVLVKFAPGLPAFLKNYVLVLSHIPFRLYFAASFLFSFAYAVLFYYLGDALEDRETGQGGAILLGLLLLVGLGWYVRRRMKSKDNT